MTAKPDTINDLTANLRQFVKAGLGSPESARTVVEAADTIDTLRAQLAEAKRDAERLDWIEKIALRELPSPPRRGMWKFGDGLIVGMSLRTAIDAAKGGGGNG
jgi:hypothetical protein